MRDVLENVLERPMVTLVREFIAEGIEEVLGNVGGEKVGQPLADGAGEALDSALAPDSPDALSSTPIREAS